VKNRAPAPNFSTKLSLEVVTKVCVLSLQKFEQLTDAFVIEFGVNVVEQKKRIFLILLNNKPINWRAAESAARFSADRSSRIFANRVRRKECPDRRGAFRSANNRKRVRLARAI
jgi:hypothetical protein